MNFELVPLKAEHLAQFKRDMQEAFRLGAAEGMGQPDDADMEILPEGDIDRSLHAKGAVAYEALVDGQPAGGAVVVIDEETQHNHLDLLFVKHGTQSRGVGQAIWNAIERAHPETGVWETVTPYFEQRNIHFYVNRCGFHIVEFYNKFNPDPNSPEEYEGEAAGEEAFSGMFRFEKVMKK